MAGSARWALLLTTTWACASSSPGYRSPTFLPVGVYRVLERVPQTRPQVTIEGTLTILPDTIMADFTPGPCTAMPSSPQAFSVRCAEVTYSFQKRDPIKYNSYAVKTTMTVIERVCVQYVANRCVQYQNEVKEQNVTRYGYLRLQAEGRR